MAVYFPQREGPRTLHVEEPAGSAMGGVQATGRHAAPWTHQKEAFNPIEPVILVVRGEIARTPGGVCVSTVDLHGSLLARDVALRTTLYRGGVE